MRVAVERLETVSRTYLVDIPDGTNDPGEIHKAVVAARNSWRENPNLDTELDMDTPDISEIKGFDAEGKPTVVLWQED